VTEPQWLDVATPTVQLRASTWGPADAPIALCLHGFPDTAYSWRKVAPALVDAGWRETPRLPTLYLHGTDDGCSEDYTPWIDRVLPDESEVALIENGAHFLQLDQPDVVARHIADFIGRAS
jgi:pimeloyl-ACP methyl ester carboxylesterase